MTEDEHFSLDIIARECEFGGQERVRRSFLRAFNQSPHAIKRMTKAQMAGLSNQ